MDFGTVKKKGEDSKLDSLEMQIHFLKLVEDLYVKGFFETDYDYHIRTMAGGVGGYERNNVVSNHGY